MMPWWVLATASTGIVVGLAYLIFRRRIELPTAHTGSSPSSDDRSEAAESKAFDQPPKSDAATSKSELAAVSGAVYSLAFGVARHDYQILGEHRDVLAEVSDAVHTAVEQPKYFPRRPALLPKLLRALNASDASRDELVRLILQDPVLAGNVLHRANSAFYRNATAPIESVDRAVQILGNEGLRGPVATAIMQPVFQLPRGFFDRFAPTTWELAQRTASAAETYIRLNGGGDPFVAHLLGLLMGLGRIVLFRLTLDTYRDRNILPRAEVFVRIMMEHELAIVRAIAEKWEMSESFLAAIDAQVNNQRADTMPILGRALAAAILAAQLAILVIHKGHDEQRSKALLIAYGLESRDVDALWTAASAPTT